MTTLSGAEPGNISGIAFALFLGGTLHIGLGGALLSNPPIRELPERPPLDQSLQGAVFFDLSDVISASEAAPSDVAPAPDSQARPEQIESPEEVKAAAAEDQPLLDDTPYKIDDPELLFKTAAPENEDDSADEAEELATEIQDEHFEQSSTAANDSVGAPPPRPKGADGSENTTADKVGFSIEEQADIAEWQRNIVLALNAVKTYPGVGREHRAEGTVIVAFTMSRGGDILVREIAESSGWPVLDQAALSVIDRAAPLPAVPAFVSGSEFDMQVPLRYAFK